MLTPDAIVAEVEDRTGGKLAPEDRRAWVEVMDQVLTEARERKHEELREVVESMAAGIQSFLSSLPYCAPENVAFQAKVKLGEPLAEFEEFFALDAD